MQKNKCDCCGEECIAYDLKAIPGRKRTKYICYRCLEEGRSLLEHRKYEEITKKKR